MSKDTCSPVCGAGRYVQESLSFLALSLGVEIDVVALDQCPVDHRVADAHLEVFMLSDGHRRMVVANGRVIGPVGAEGAPADIVDKTFVSIVRFLQYPLVAGAHPVHEDRAVYRAAQAWAMNLEIDQWSLGAQSPICPFGSDPGCSGARLWAPV